VGISGRLVAINRLAHYPLPIGAQAESAHCA